MISREIGNGSNPQLGSVRLVFGPIGALGCAGALVAAGGVEGEVAQDFAGGGVDDADVRSLITSSGRRQPSQRITFDNNDSAAEGAVFGASMIRRTPDSLRS